PAARRRGAGVADRSAVLQMANAAALVVPGISRADAVCRAAHGAADHPSSVHAAKLPAGAGRGAVAGAAEPGRTLLGMELEEPDRGTVAGLRSRVRRLDGPYLGTPRHGVAGRCRGDHQPRWNLAPARRPPAPGEPRPTAAHPPTRQ